MISNTPRVKKSIAFLFKSSACFEWQKQGNTIEVIKKLNSDYAVLTLMMRGERNVQPSRNYFKNLFKDEFSNYETHELLAKKEYILIIKLNK